jgi:hypothetical protein
MALEDVLSALIPTAVGVLLLESRLSERLRMQQALTVCIYICVVGLWVGWTNASAELRQLQLDRERERDRATRDADACEEKHDEYVELVKPELEKAGKYLASWEECIDVLDHYTVPPQAFSDYVKPKNPLPKKALPKCSPRLAYGDPLPDDWCWFDDGTYARCEGWGAPDHDGSGKPYCRIVFEREYADR